MHTWQVKIGVLVQHQGLISVLEYREVLELNKELGNLILVNKETCEKHERNNQNGGKGDCKLLVTEDGSEDQSIASRGVVDQEKDDDYKRRIVRIKAEIYYLRKTGNL